MSKCEPSTKKRRYGIITGTICAVPLCRNNRAQNKELTWHGFPNETALRKEWIRRVRRKGGAGRFSVWEPTKHHKICGIHFNKSGKRGYMDRLPVFFPWKDYTTVKVPSPQKKRKQKVNSTAPLELHLDSSYNADDLLLPQEQVLVDSFKITFSSLDMGSEVEYSQNLALPAAFVGEMMQQDIYQPANEVDSSNKDHNYIITLNLEDPSNLKKLEKQKQLIDLLVVQNSALKTQSTKLTEENMSLKKENRQLEKRCKCLEASLTIEKSKSPQTNKFGMDVIAFDDKKVRFFTGFKSYVLLLNFFEIIIRGYELNNPLSKRIGRPQSLGYQDQLLLVLCRLRLGLLESDLAQRFDVSESTVSRLWGTWIPFMASYLSLFNYWPSQALVQKYMPESFKVDYPTTRVILDCTEIFIENPSEFRVQSETFSNYKAHNTAKGLVGITPNGVVSLVSDLYGGRVSDKVITENSGLYSKLDHGDSVMADRGFLIADRLEPLGVRLNIPPFLKGKPQLSLDDEKLTRNIAKVRIHVERVIRGIKQYRILKYVFPNSMSSKLNDIWKICCYLNNFNNDPLLDREPN